MDEFDLSSLNLATSDEDSVHVHAGFELLKEVAVFAAVVASLRHGDEPLTRNRAIAMGNLIRIARLARSMVAQVADGHGGDQQLALSRQLLDSAATLAYLIENDEEHADRFDSYAFDGLIAEREFLKDVRAQIARRDGTRLPIEDRIENSIRDTLLAAGIDESDIPSRRSNGWPSAETRMKLLGPVAYSAYRTSSGAVHGSFTDLFLHYLEFDGSGGFEVREPAYPYVPQTLLTSGLLTLEAAALVLRTYINPVPLELQRAFFRLHSRLRQADEYHESAMQRVRTRDAASE